MRRGPRAFRKLRPSPAMAVACIALAVALGGIGYGATLLPRNSVGTHQVVNHSLRASDFKPGQLPGDASGGWVVDNRDDLACPGTVILASHTIRISVRSRVWTFFQDTFVPGPGNDVEAGLFVRLRNRAGTRTLGSSAIAWESIDPGETDVALPLAGGGPLFPGSDLEALAPPVLVASPGKYRLQLVTQLNAGDCGTGANRPDFGWNRTSVYGYGLLGTH